MNRAMIAGGALGTIIVILALAFGQGAPDQVIDSGAATATGSFAESHPGLQYGRVTLVDGATYEGRLRWGGDEEALWGNYFNGFKDENPWAGSVPSDRLTGARRSIKVFGIELARARKVDLGRPFMARFGDIARIDADGSDLQVTLKSGTVFHLDRYSADDLADGVRVWDEQRGVVDLGEWKIRTIELLPNAGSGGGPYPLYGTVRTRQGDFTGFVQWDREEAVGPDALDGYTEEGELLSLRFDDIRSIARRSHDSSLVTLLDGREIVLSGTREVGQNNRGIYVDDPRYGRVLISRDAFERIDFSAGGTGPAYGDYPPGRSLAGRVTTRSGRQLAGRLVYDLDESETTETLDAPSQGIDYTIPFGLIASIVPAALDDRGAQRARVILHSGEALELERAGDLGEGNGGLLVFPRSGDAPEFVSWSEVEQIDLDRPPEMYPPGTKPS